MKFSRSTYWVIACTLLFIAGGLYYFNKYEPPPPPRVQETKAADPNSFVTFSGSSIIQQQDGKKHWELTAETVQVQPGSDKVQLVNFKGTMYRADGGKVDLIGRQAQMDTKTRDIVMEGDVKATASDGAVFTAAQARWASKERRFYGSGGITLTREDTVVTGNQIEGDEQLEKVKVMGNARVLKGGTPQ